LLDCPRARHATALETHKHNMPQSGSSYKKPLLAHREEDGSSLTH
jgi:hypothetical protein